MTGSGAKALRLLVLAGATLFALPALADYPLSGKWTYDDAAGKGPAKTCGKRQMEFSGMQRHDTEGGVHDYRNVSVVPAGRDVWRITDEFANAQTRGARVTFTLRRLDADHIDIRIAAGGTSFRLRRCG